MDEETLNTNPTSKPTMASRHSGFAARSIYTFRQPRMFSVAREKLSFTVAAVTVTAFVMGNMVGQHGWYAFWKSVLGENDDTQIIFDGMVTPVQFVPDYVRWREYGGSSEANTYAQVPRDLLVPLPAYRASELKNLKDLPYEVRTNAQFVYSMGNLSSYDSGDDGSGSHTGVDIRLPLGTFVRSIANGIVDRVVNQEYGFGHYIVVRYPNVPDPTSSKGTSTFYATYAHLDAIFVREGQVVRKGEQLATSGQSGLASGPHLHFQIDTDEALYHPFWAFTSTEASAAGMTFTQAVNAGLNKNLASLYTVSPVQLVQNFESYSAPTLASNGNAALKGVVAQKTILPQRVFTAKEKLLSRAAIRATSRQSAAELRSARIAARHAASEKHVAATPALQKVASTTDVSLPQVQGTNQDVTKVEIQHSGSIERSWQKVQIRAEDHEGRVVSTPSFTGKLYIRSEFGDAEIRPDELVASDFTNGVATVNVLIRDKKTVFLVTRGAFETRSAPIVSAAR